MDSHIARSARQIGTAIRKMRRKVSLSQTELGEKAGLRQATISQIENGESGTKIETICNVLTALNLEFTIKNRSKASGEDIEAIF